MNLLTNQQRLGELSMVGSAVLWGLLPVISKQAYAHIPVMVCAALSALAAALFFALLTTVRGEWREVLNREAMASSLISALGIGVIYYGMVFWGQSMVPASTTSVLLLMEVFFSMLLLRLMGHEQLSRRQVMGALVMVVGAILVLAPDSVDAFGYGELIILLAAAVPPLANYHMQKARKLVGVSSIMFVRSVISFVMLAAVALTVELMPSTDALLAALPWVVVNGLLLFGISKVLFVEAIRRIPISKAIAMNSLTPLVALASAWWMLNEPAGWYQWLGCVPLSWGCWLLVSSGRMRTSAVAPIANAKNTSTPGTTSRATPGTTSAPEPEAR